MGAHCGAPWPYDIYCKEYQPVDMLWEDGIALGAPHVYVARGKHANYPRLDICNSFANQTGDECGTGYQYRFPMGGMWHTTGNIGSRSYPLIDVTGPISNSALPDPGVVERIWATPPYATYSELKNKHDECVATYGRPFGRFNGWKQAAWGEPPPPYGWQFLKHLGL